MRLTRLDINGFKSFAKKTELEFSDGITAVIGPNGSGKSNISDAVRWVLGEQSARALRGTRMEDVIFSGTQSKRALSFCEVTLTFDNSDHLLPVDYDEVAITRRVYRSGESEYCINRTECRLKDIQELFHDTGIGKDGYSIIGQGKVDEILSNRSQDRRTALEEAAGVMRYRVRKQEAERKLEHTEKNLERIEDILFELRSRLGPLEEQSRSAREFLRLRDELKDNEVNLLLLQSERLGERAEACRETIAQMKKEEASEAEGEQAVLGAISDCELRIRTLEGMISQYQNRLFSLLSESESSQSECRVLEERIRRASGDRESAENRIAALSEKETALHDRIGTLAGEDAADVSSDSYAEQIAEASRSLQAFEQEIGLLESQIDERKNAVIDAMNRLSDARSLIMHFETMRTALQDRADAAAGEAEDLRKRGDALEKELAQAEDELKLMSSEEDDRKAVLARIISEMNETNARIARDRERSEFLVGEVSSLRSRMNALSELVKNREGYFESVRLVMKEAENDRRLKDSVVGVVAELIRVPEEYETAISMSLGSAIQNIVTRTAEDARLVIDILRRKELGRVTLLPMDLLKIDSQGNASLRGVSGVIGIASDLIEYDPRAEKAIRYLLGRTVVVKDLESGIRLRRSGVSGIQIASLDGDIIAVGGAMSGGSQKKRVSSLLGREREIDSLRKQIMEKEKEQSVLVAELNDLKAQAECLNDSVGKAQAAWQESRIHTTRQQEKTEIIRRDIEENDLQTDKLKAEKQSVLDNIEDLVRQRREADTVQTGIEQDNTLARQKIAEDQKLLFAMRTERESKAAGLSDLRIRAAANEKERASRRKEMERLKQELRSVQNDLQKEKDVLLSIDGERGRIEAQLDEIRSRAESEKETMDACREEQRRLEEEKSASGDRLSELRAKREEMLSMARDRAERIHRQELLLERADTELKGLEDHIWNEYQLTLQNALPFKREVTLTALNGTIARLKEEMRALGDVNVSAIDEFRTVSERNDLMTQQRDDLRMAKSDLESMIDDLTSGMEREFKAKFDLIRENFELTFVELFGGGHAELRLSDERDVLNCDIDIIAQPPGKKLQLLSLLSGGERALTAIALLFAMLRIKPPAFCVLDEIESSLDEANVDRFAEYLKTYSSQTQFIVITHRKGSMAAADSLYGVSMEEKGISTIVSARLDGIAG